MTPRPCNAMAKWSFRRIAVVGLAMLAGLVLGREMPAHGAERAEQPNIILILADDLGYGTLGCYGQKKIHTPHLDRLASQGMRFTQAYAGCHVCQPSRSTLMQGLHTGHSAVRANNVDQLLLPEDTTIATRLLRAGYRTGAFGKWGLGYEGTTGHPNRQGFEEYFGQLLQVHAHFYYPYWVWHNEQRYMLPGNEGGARRQYVQDVIHAQAMEFLRRQSKDEPFFAYLPYIIPHVELVVPPDSEAPYRGQFPKIAILDPRPGYLGSEDGLTTFAGMISRLDRQIGEILDWLDTSGLADNTIVIFTSDNGGQNGGRDAGWTRMTDYFAANGPLRGYKGTFYEGGLRVPFIVRWPGHVAPGSVSDHPCAFWDVAATLCEAAGIEPPSPTDGLSILPTLTGQGTQRQHEGLYWEYPVRGGIARAARMGPWKVVQKGPNAPCELYNLECDLGEATDVAEQYPDRVAAIVAWMDRQHVPVRSYPPVGPKTGVADYVR